MRVFDVIISAGYRNVILFITPSHSFSSLLIFTPARLFSSTQPSVFCFFLVKVIEQNHRLAGSDIYFLKYILCIRILELLPSDYSKQLRKGQKDALMFTRHTRSVQQEGRERRRSVRCKGGTSDLCSSMHSLTE